MKIIYILILLFIIGICVNSCGEFHDSVFSAKDVGMIRVKIQIEDQSACMETDKALWDHHARTGDGLQTNWHDCN